MIDINKIRRNERIIKYNASINKYLKYFTDIDINDFLYENNKIIPPSRLL